MVLRWYLVNDSDFTDKLCLLTASSNNFSSIWATFTFPWLLLRRLMFQLLLTLVLFLSIINFSYLALQFGRRNLKRFSLDVIDVLDELDEDLEPLMSI